MLTVERIIELLELDPFPCGGGDYRETYRSQLSIPCDALPSSYSEDRPISTAIYYVLTPDSFSALHRLPGDEIYHFYYGDPVEMLQLHADGTGELIKIGCDLAMDLRPQVLAPGRCWQGSRLISGGQVALMGTTMAPGFDFADYESANRDELTSRYPNFAELIRALTLQ